MKGLCSVFGITLLNILPITLMTILISKSEGVELGLGSMPQPAHRTGTGMRDDLKFGSTLVSLLTIGLLLQEDI